MPFLFRFFSVVVSFLSFLIQRCYGFPNVWSLFRWIAILFRRKVVLKRLVFCEASCYPSWFLNNESCCNGIAEYQMAPDKIIREQRVPAKKNSPGWRNILLKKPRKIFLSSWFRLGFCFGNSVLLLPRFVCYCRKHVPDFWYKDASDFSPVWLGFGESLIYFDEMDEFAVEVLLSLYPADTGTFGLSLKNENLCFLFIYFHCAVSFLWLDVFTGRR